MTETQREFLTTGPPRARERIPANRWKGERGCLVGPFRAKSQAQVFEHYVLHHNGVKTTSEAVRERQDGWYIDIPS